MKMTVEAFQPHHISGVKAFNQRLLNGGSSFQFPEYTQPDWLPKIRQEQKNWQEYFVVLDENTEVRGAFMLKHQLFRILGQDLMIADLQLPISEGIVNDQWAPVGVFIIKAALKKQTLLFGLGMGGLENPLPRTFKALGWNLSLVPFFFRIQNIKEFLLNFYLFKKNILFKSASRCLAYTRTADFFFYIYLALKRLKIKVNNLLKGAQVSAQITYQEITDFDSRIDHLWQETAPNYIFSACRNLECLNDLYPSQNSRDPVRKLLVFEDNKFIGWAIVLRSNLKNHKHFGNMTLGSLVDNFAYADKEPLIIEAVIKYFNDKPVDLIVSNQGSKVWQNSLVKNRFLAGPSNFVLALSGQLNKLFKNNSGFEIASSMINRGDGDGPINLY